METLVEPHEFSSRGKGERGARFCIRVSFESIMHGGECWQAWQPGQAFSQYGSCGRWRWR